MADQEDSLGKIVRDFEARKISRREFFLRATLLGLSLPLIGSILASCAQPEATATPAPAATAAPTATPAPAATAAPAATVAPTATPAPTATAAPTATPAEAKPKVGGTLREGYDLDFSRMDPVATDWYDPGFFALYDALVTSDPDGKIVSQLAESWETSADGLTWTYKIKSGLKFHSGRELGAPQIKEVYDAIMAPGSGSPLQSTWAPVEKVEAPDATTLVIRMKHTYANWPNVAKTGYARICNIEVRTKLGVDYGKKVIDGSGPFSFVEWVPGDHVSVKRWEDYPGSIVPYIENKGKAYLDAVNWHFIPEAGQRAVLLEAGDIDTLHGFAPQDSDRLKANPDIAVTTLYEWSGFFLCLNWIQEALEFKDKRVRQAISHAIDRPGLVKGIFFGQAAPDYGPIVSADMYYNPEVEKYNQYDLDKAKSLMKEAGWTPGADGILEKGGKKFEFSVINQQDSIHIQLNAAIQAQLKELGMSVKTQTLDRASYFNKAIGENATMEGMLWFYLWPVPMDVVGLFVQSTLAPVPNWSNVNSPEIDAAIAAWQSAANAAELKKACEDLQLIWARECLIPTILTKNNLWANRKSVHGWLPHQWNLYPYYNDVWLE